MTLFAWFVIAHLIGDYLLQTGNMAMNKAAGRFFNWALFSHCLVYTLAFAPVLYGYGLSFAWLGVIFATHAFLDRRWPVIAWRRRVSGASDEVIANTFWLTIVTDQIFHLIVLALIATFGAA